jgi:hypothetical protein
MGNDTSSRAGNNYYSGVSVVRYDSAFTVTSSHCDTTTTNGDAVVYQAMWLAMDAAAYTWLELGTGHKNCSSGEFKWWYIWMNPNGFSGYLWTQVISGSVQHRFYITNGTDGYWRWFIDTTQEKAYYWPNLGFWLQAGMESYDPSASAPNHDYDGMVHQVNWSGWQGWIAGANPWDTCRALVPPSLWCVDDTSLSGNYVAANRGVASEP